MNIHDQIKQTGFMWAEDIIFAFYSGSAAHGATGNKPTDTDISGVYIPPPVTVLGLRPHQEDAEGKKKFFDPDTHIWKPDGHNALVAAGDIDLNLYSLRKWAGMAAVGNSNAIEMLFVKGENPSYCWLEHIVGNYPIFLSKHSGHHFLAFAKAMKLRLSGGNTGKHGQRPELEAEFGYDVKGAMHMLRVLGEGIELMRMGRLTMPRPEAPFLKDVRNGKHKWAEIEEIYNGRFSALEAATIDSDLPDDIDRDRISEVITKAQIEFWGLG